ncbi:MAG: NAD-dependent epimerase/dehydratase family protein [Gammaproteobacteria bacterium]|nr:NAD-dependent epimerase/dehydratase family protein [Gammaproteobacteria bacterium]
MANYLITGGCGFIGSHLAESLLNDGHTVRVLDDLSTGKRENLPPQCRLIVGDVADSAMVRSCMEGMDGCFHLAAVASVQESNENWIGSHRVNLTGSISVFDAARLNKTPVVYASSAAVYGDNADMPLKECSDVSPLTAYGADKLGSELHARVASLVHGVPTVGLRFFNVYGPRQNPSSPYSGVISIFVDRILRGEFLVVFGDGEQTRDFVYVGDVVRFMQTAMSRTERTPAVFNVCTGMFVSISQLAKTVMSITGKQVSLTRQLSRKGDIRVSVGDPSHAKRQLGVTAERSLVDGLRTLIEYVAVEDMATDRQACSG